MTMIDRVVADSVLAELTVQLVAAITDHRWADVDQIQAQMGQRGRELGLLDD